MVLEGRARLRVGSEELEIHPGQIVFIKADTAHAFFAIEQDLALLDLFSTMKSGAPLP